MSLMLARARQGMLTRRTLTSFMSRAACTRPANGVLGRGTCKKPRDGFDWGLRNNARMRRWRKRNSFAALQPIISYFIR